MKKNWLLVVGLCILIISACANITAQNQNTDVMVLTQYSEEVTTTSEPKLIIPELIEPLTEEEEQEFFVHPNSISTLTNHAIKTYVESYAASGKMADRLVSNILTNCKITDFSSDNKPYMYNWASNYNLMAQTIDAAHAGIPVDNAKDIAGNIYGAITEVISADSYGFISYEPNADVDCSKFYTINKDTGLLGLENNLITRLDTEGVHYYKDIIESMPRDCDYYTYNMPDITEFFEIDFGNEIDFDDIVTLKVRYCDRFLYNKTYYYLLNLDNRIEILVSETDYLPIMARTNGKTIFYAFDTNYTNYGVLTELVKVHKAITE